MTILLPADKLTHYAVGTLITAALLPFGADWAAGICTLAAALREVWGLYRGGKFDPLDLAATLLGCAVVLAAVLLAG